MATVKRMGARDKLQLAGPGPSKNNLNTILFKVTCDCGREHLLEIGMLQYQIAARILEEKTLSPLTNPIPGLTLRHVP